VLVTSTPFAPTPAAATPSADPSGSARDRATGGHPVAITLITGDRVLFDPTDPGGPIIDGLRPGTTYETYRRNGHWFVLPADAQSLVRAGRVDEKLFDVTTLAADGVVGDAPLRVIVDYGGPTAPATGQGLLARAEGVPAGRPTHVLESVGAVAVDVDLSQPGTAWRALAPSAPDARTLQGGVDRLLLDRKVPVTLDVSVPRIGAPAAWAAGYDGTGVTVAVLDTGADLAHPDLAGRVLAHRSFVPGQTVADGNGHGTHVAATVAGSGAGGVPARPGVAPGARLAVGKVLDDGGSGQISGIVEGMEWAATEAGADIVNMSLGGEPGGAMDLLDAAVNRLTVEHGALFVIAAGNSGPGGSTLNSPGTADLALTVGAVDKSDQPASFSSRGPRAGDAALKPEITAPGVDIVAARAGGTGMGTPVNPLYTAANGTSMATPHVAGAAAILAQLHPGWTPEQLKAALVGSAHDLGQPVFTQGAGRLDVAQAVRQTVVGTPATLSIGRVEPGDLSPRTQRLTYRNTGAVPVSLNLTASLATPGGDPAPDGAVRLSASDVTVPAGGTAEVTVTVTPQPGLLGAFSGHVLATGGGVRLSTPVGLVQSPPTRRLTIRVIDFDGTPLVLPRKVVTTGRVDIPDGGWTSYELAGASAELRVTEGVYAIDMWASLDFLTPLFGARYVDAAIPEVTVKGDTDVVFDLRQMKGVTVRTEEASYIENLLMLYERRPSAGAAYRRSLVLGEGDKTVYVLPTGRKVTVGHYDAGHITTRSAPQLTVRAHRVEVRPRYAWTSGERPFGDRPQLPMFPAGNRHVEVVDGGRGDKPVTRDVRNRVVLLRLPSNGDFPAYLVETSRQLRAAGALGVLVAESEPGRNTAPSALSGYLELPTAALSQADGAALAGALRNGSATVHLTSTPRAAYAYHLAHYWRDEVPRDVSYSARNRDMVAVDTEFPSTEDRLYRLGASVVRSDMHWNLPAVYQFWAPTRRVDYYGPTGPGMRWKRMLLPFDEPGLLQLFLWGRWDDFTRPERRNERWGAAPDRLGQVVRTAQPPAEPVPYLLSRQGDTLYPVPQRVDGEGATHWGGFTDGVAWPGLQFDGAVVTVGLDRDGVALPARTVGSATVFDVPAGRGRYQLRLGYDPAHPGREKYRTETVWDFTSERRRSHAVTDGYSCGATAVGAEPDGSACGAVALPLLDFDVTADERNRLAAPGLSTVDLRLRYQPGVVPQRIRSVQAWTSVDGGRSWTAAPAHRTGGHNARVLMSMGPVDEGTTVSVRVKVTDANGNAVTETLYDAFGTVRAGS
jgi:subtilisin family serine protease